MHADYVSSAIRQLRDQQVRFAPREKKIEQVNRAERLLDRDPAGARRTPTSISAIASPISVPSRMPRHKMTGATPSTICGCLSRTCRTRPTCRRMRPASRCSRSKDLSKTFNVSTKTISRWRQQGLVSRRFVFDGRKRVGFLAQLGRSVRSAERGPRSPRRALQPAQRGRARRDHRRARRLAQAGGCPAEVARRVAERMNRSVETIRYTIKQFDQEHPDLAIFRPAAAR